MVSVSIFHSEPHYSVEADVCNPVQLVGMFMEVLSPNSACVGNPKPAAIENSNHAGVGNPKHAMFSKESTNVVYSN